MLFEIGSDLTAQHDIDHDPVAQLINGTRTTNLGCGARALDLLLASMGRTTSLSEISSRIDPQGTGICSAADIITYLNSKSIRARLVTSNYEDLLTSKEKILIILKNIAGKDVRHFVFAIPTKSGGLELIDPTLSIDPFPVTKEWLSKRWDGYAILVSNS